MAWLKRWANEVFWIWDSFIGIAQIAAAIIIAYYTKTDINQSIKAAFFCLSVWIFMQGLRAVFSNPVTEELKKQELVAKRVASEPPPAVPTPSSVTEKDATV